MNTKTKEEVIEAIRSVSKSIGKEVVTKNQFKAHSGITGVTISDVYKYFKSWSEACLVAGVEHDRSREPISDEVLLTDWGNVTREVGHIPPLTEFLLHSKHGRNAYNRFGMWTDVPDVFSKFFGGSEEWEDVLDIIAQHSPKPRVIKPIPALKTSHQGGVGRWQRLENRPIFGDPIDFRGLRHAPVNEQGVVFLFGMVALELGYSVEAIQIGYPDCEAKRRIDRGWQTVQIEFEYASRHFVDHGHDPKKCDVIVCWIHNWTECPDDIDVLTLSEVIKNL